MENIKELKEKIKNLKVLFVDDDKDFRDGTALFLKKFFDTVIVCSDGQEGLDTFMHTKEFDIVITDVMMPKMDGITMLKKIKEIKPNIFCVIVTASRGPNICDDNFCNVFFKKPMSFDDITMLMQKVEHLK